MIVGFHKYTNSTPQCDLKVRGLQLAMSEVRGKLQVSPDIIRRFLLNTPTLKFYRNAKEVFPCYRNFITPLGK